MISETGPHIHRRIADKYECQKCRHDWTPRNTERMPMVCPKCKSRNWDKPKKIGLGRPSKKVLTERVLAACPRAEKFSACTDIDPLKCQCADGHYGPCPCENCHSRPAIDATIAKS